MASSISSSSSDSSSSVLNSSISSVKNNTKNAVKTAVIETKDQQIEENLVADELVPSGSFNPVFVILYCLLAATPGLIFAIGIGFSAHMNTIIVRNGYMAEEFLSLYSSVLTLGAMGGSVFCGFFTMNFIGRKYSIFVSALISLIGFGIHLIVLVPNIADHISILILLNFSRVITGVGIGIGLVAAPVYVAEISPIKMFNYTSVIYQIYLGLGFVVIFITSFGTDRADIAGGSVIFNTFTQGKIWLPVVGMICCVIQALCALIIPYSPMWLISKKRYLVNSGKKILKNNQRLYRTEYNFSYLMSISKEASKTNTYNFDPLTTPVGMRIIFIVFMVQFYQQFSGINPILFNASNIFQNAGLREQTLGLIILGFAHFVGAILAFIVNTYVGKKMILVVTSAIISILHLVFGLHTRYLADRSELSWLPVFLLVLFLILFNIGWGPIPYIINSAFFPDEVTNLGSGLGIMWNWLMAFTITFPYFYMQEAMGLDGVFFFFAAIMASAVIMCSVFLPEFRHKPKEQVIKGIEISFVNTKF